ncbi:MAG: orotidine-5'-phosphate decarboxylase [Candidatus Acidiferrales bacterium]
MPARHGGPRSFAVANRTYGGASTSRIDLARKRLIVALDFEDIKSAFPLAKLLAQHVGMFKINTHLFTAEGPAAVAKLARLGPGVFLDLKFHDIPSVVGGAVRSAVSLPGVRLVDMHALAGIAAMAEAARARRSAKGGAARPKVIAVTILTSHDKASLRRLGIDDRIPQQVRRLAILARQAGLDGVVASPHEVQAIRRACGSRFLIVVPGIRPAARTGRNDDQSRTATPAATIRAGADYLVIGRPITAAAEPAAAARAILDEMAAALP